MGMQWHLIKWEIGPVGCDASRGDIQHNVRLARPHRGASYCHGAFVPSGQWQLQLLPPGYRQWRTQDFIKGKTRTEIFLHSSQ